MPTLPPSIDIVNGTHIVPLWFPETLQPYEVDKLGWTAIITLGWPSLAGGLALIVGTKDWKRYSYTPLCIAWFWSVALVAVSIFTRYGRYDHLLHYFVIAHVQWEWLIITYLLGGSFAQGYLNATLIGLLLYVTDLGFSGIRATFVLATILGGWGDVFMPLLLWNGGQRLLALGGVGHFLNALVTFIAFTDYIPVGPYLALQLILGGSHVFLTTVGIFRLQHSHSQSQTPAIHLAGDDDGLGINLIPGTSQLVNVKTNDAVETETHRVIPIPSREDVIRLAVIATVLSLGASLPLNFVPKFKLY